MDPDQTIYPCNSAVPFQTQGQDEDGVSLPSLMQHFNSNGIFNDNPNALDDTSFTSWQSRLWSQPPEFFSATFDPFSSTALPPALEFWTSPSSSDLQSHGSSDSSDAPTDASFPEGLLPSERFVERKIRNDIQVPQELIALGKLANSSTSWLAPSSAAGGDGGKFGILHPSRVLQE